MLKNAGVPDGEVLQESLVLGYLGLEGGEGDPRLMTRCSVLHSIFHCHYSEKKKITDDIYVKITPNQILVSVGYFLFVSSSFFKSKKAFLDIIFCYQLE